VVVSRYSAATAVSCSASAASSAASASPRSAGAIHAADGAEAAGLKASPRITQLRPIQIWVPDVRSPQFAAQAHQQSLALASSPHEADDQAFIDALADDE